MELTSNQQKVFDYLRRSAENAVPPTVREICRTTGIRSTSTVFAVLTTLEKMGLITREAGSSRSIRVTGTVPSVSVPLVGVVTAGLPILAQENIEQYLPLPADVSRGREIFALRVRGMSMMNAGILDGDIVYAERTSTAQRGEIVVALIGDEATVKRLDYLEDGRTVLRPENDAFEPIVPDEVTLLGRLVASFRKYE